jgi:hypothetical protein
MTTETDFAWRYFVGNDGDVMNWCTVIIIIIVIGAVLQG